MDLHAITLPGAIGDLHFEVASFTGLDRLLCFLPERLQLEHVARRIVKSLEERGGGGPTAIGHRSAVESQDLKGAFERIIPVVFWTVIALVGILMLALAWRGTLRAQARVRAMR